MHEFAVISDIVRAVIKEAEKYKKLKSVKEVVLNIGELTFLNPDQLSFSFSVLSEGTVLEGSRLIIENIKAKIKCTSCEYEGPIKYLEEEKMHYSIPIFSCPKCKMPVKITEGKECVVKSVRLILEDNENF